MATLNIAEELFNLKAYMRMKNISYTEAGNWLGTSKTYVSQRMNGRMYFTTNDIAIICKNLDIPKAQIVQYFFVKEDQKLLKDLTAKEYYKKMVPGTQSLPLPSAVMTGVIGIRVRTESKGIQLFRGDHRGVEYCPVNDTYWVKGRQFDSNVVVDIVFAKDEKDLNALSARDAQRVVELAYGDK